MKIDNTFPIKVWGEIFNDFRQTEHVHVDSSAERLDITIREREGVLQVTREELDDSLYKFNGNPKEVATSFLKKHGVLVYYQDTLVGYFDIQAYSYFIEETRIEEAILKLSRFFSSTSGSASTDILAVKLNHWILSDSIILVVDTNHHPLFEGSLVAFLSICSVDYARCHETWLSFERGHWRWKLLQRRGDHGEFWIGGCCPLRERAELAGCCFDTQSASNCGKGKRI